MQTQGDRVMTEYYLQFADHYFRVLSESRARFEEQNPNQQSQPRRQYLAEATISTARASMARAPRTGWKATRSNAPRSIASRAARTPMTRMTRQQREMRDGRDDRDNARENGQRDNRGNRDTGNGRDNGNNRPHAGDRDEQRPPRLQREPYPPREAAPRAEQPRCALAVRRRRRGRAGAPAPWPSAAPRRGPASNGDGDEAQPTQIEVDRLPPAFAPSEAVAEQVEAAPAGRGRRRAASKPVDGEVLAVEGDVVVEAAPRRRRIRREGTDDNVAA